ncbi:MAG: hypothetical protein ACPLSJ_02620 [Thermosulfidibacteraceae bacterium]|jgi:futalosine hydrolase
MKKVVLIVATEDEVRPLLKELNPQLIREKPWRCYLLDDRIITISGIGKSLAGSATTYSILEFKPAYIINMGIAGCYPDSGLKIGDLAFATEEVFGDEPFQNDPLKLYTPKFLEESGIRGGRFVTLSKIPTTVEEARKIGKELGAICENMEGASVAEISKLFDIKCSEIRSISNIAGVRNKKLWNIELAVNNLCNFLKKYWRKLDEDKNSL